MVKNIITYRKATFCLFHDKTENGRLLRWEMFSEPMRVPYIQFNVTVIRQPHTFIE